jgi:hypothetical protein
MKNMSKVRRAALAALAAAALMAAAGPASAAIYRFPVDVAKLPDTRVRRLDDGSGGIHGRLRMMLASVRRFSWEGILAERQPARVQPRDR